TTTVPPTTTEPTTVPPTTVPPTTHPTTPAAKPTRTPPHGTGHTPSVVGGLSSGAPHTGGSGQDGTPVNTLIGGGLLFAALGLFSRNVLGGRKGGPDGTN
ncbi:hypothetical protein, partial [Intrasporangium chromatireducens]|uniref:hypothetical protein n=1 Tax=Intrasporangium chromatireducens TaxID=1386088 RepID=UPI0005564658